MENLTKYKNADFDFFTHLTQFLKPQVYQAGTEIIYQGHVPVAAFYLLGGSLTFKKRNKTVAKIENGEHFLIGATELLRNKKFPYSVTLSTDAQVYILCRSTLLELIEHDHLPCPQDRHLSKHPA